MISLVPPLTALSLLLEATLDLLAHSLDNFPSLLPGVKPAFFFPENILRGKLGSTQCAVLVVRV